MKVKIFNEQSYPHAKLESEINEFLDNDDIQLIDIKTSEVGGSTGYSYTALVIYENLVDLTEPWNFDQANK